MAKQWVFFGIGVWIIISPWILGFSEISLAKWSNVLLGIVLVIISSREIFDGKM